VLFSLLSKDTCTKYAPLRRRLPAHRRQIIYIEQRLQIIGKRDFREIVGSVAIINLFSIDAEKFKGRLPNQNNMSGDFENASPKQRTPDYFSPLLQSALKLDTESLN
jgi:hypothetical protein